MFLARDERERHILCLESTCRICGARDLHRSVHNKTNYETEMMEVFKIDIKTDVKEVHPTALCRSHELLLLKFRRLKSEGRSNEFNTRVIPVRFNPHDNGCNICVSKKGRKRKRQESLHEVTRAKNNVAAISTTDEVDSVLACILKMTCTNRLQLLEKLVNRLTEDELSHLAKAIGINQATAMKIDTDTVAHQYLNRKNLLDFKTNAWLSQRNKVLLNFITGISVLDYNNAQELQRITLCRIIEQVYGLSMKKLVAPLSFLLSLNIYTKTSSRSVVDLIGKTSPSGSKQNVTKMDNKFRKCITTLSSTVFDVWV